MFVCNNFQLKKKKLLVNLKRVDSWHLVRDLHHFSVLQKKYIWKTFFKCLSFNVFKKSILHKTHHKQKLENAQYLNFWSTWVGVQHGEIDTTFELIVRYK